MLVLEFQVFTKKLFEPNKKFWSLCLRMLIWVNFLQNAYKFQSFFSQYASILKMSFNDLISDFFEIVEKYYFKIYLLNKTCFYI